MKAEDILSIDFSKYNKIAINGVYMQGIDVEVGDEPAQVVIFGKLNGYLFMTASFMKDSKVRIAENSGDYLSIREVKKCIYCAK